MRYVVKERRPWQPENTEGSIIRRSRTKELADAFARSWKKEFPKHEIWVEPEAHSPNASYYVWVLAPHSDAPLSSEGPYGPHPLRKAEQMARIGAQEGIHDRAVSVGKDPEARGFEITRRYQAGTGARII